MRLGVEGIGAEGNSWRIHGPWIHFPGDSDGKVSAYSAGDLGSKEMATHSSTLARKIPWRSLVGYSPSGRKESDTTERLHFHFQAGSKGDRGRGRVTVGGGEGDGTPLQYSCLENPMDGGAW